MAKANGLPGLYIVLDGIIGCGKGAQINELKKHLPTDFPNSDIVFTYEPGGNPEADKLRQRLKHEQMLPDEEMYLFAESRSITLPQVVAPVLARGGVVISDRSFTTSLAYQAFGGRDLGFAKVWQANENAVNGLFPDLVIHLKGDIKTCLERSSLKDQPDKFDAEGMEFWRKCDDGFEKMIDCLKILMPDTQVLQIKDLEGKLSIEETRVLMQEGLYPILKEHFHEGRILNERQV